MSRARETSHVYVVADDLDQAVEILTIEWSADRRQRWVLDVDEPAVDDRARRPNLARRTESTLRLARLRAELRSQHRSRLGQMRADGKDQRPVVAFRRGLDGVDQRG
jgi:hypothetical protein